MSTKVTNAFSIKNGGQSIKCMSLTCLFKLAITWLTAMFCHVVSIFEQLPTIPTHARLQMLGLDVCFQRTTLSKGAATCITFVWTLTAVHARMVDQMMFDFETFITIWTRVWSLLIANVIWVSDCSQLFIFWLLQWHRGIS